MLRIRAEPGAAQRELRDHDERFYVERPRPLALGSTQSLPVPGRLGLGDQELELHATGGHTADGMAVFAPWIGVLVVGDYLSPVEIPMISPGRLGGRLPLTLAALAPVVERASTVVPGHGAVLDRDAALRVLEEDMAYLDALEQAARPAATRPSRRRIHEANLRAAAG